MCCTHTISSSVKVTVFVSTVICIAKVLSFNTTDKTGKYAKILTNSYEITNKCVLRYTLMASEAALKHTSWKTL